MTRYTRSDDGKYHVSGHSYDRLEGSRAEVWHGTAYKTSGGLTKSHLIKNKSGRIVSKSKHSTAKREQRLLKYGYGTQKGKFGFVKLSKRARSSAMKGGAIYGSSISPAGAMASGIDGQGITDYSAMGSIGVQEAAGMAGGRRHISRRHKRGGKGLVMSPADVIASGIDGQGITDYGSLGSVGVQAAAGMAGGKRSKSRRHRRGGTTSRSGMGQGTAVLMGSPLNAALNA
jgi:hypothetical protein